MRKCRFLKGGVPFFEHDIPILPVLFTEKLSEYSVRSEYSILAVTCMGIQQSSPLRLDCILMDGLLGRASIPRIRMLIECGCDVNVDRGNTLKMAIMCNYTEVVSILLEAGADPNIWFGPRTYFVHNQYPMEYALEYASFEIVSMLMSAGAVMPLYPMCCVRRSHRDIPLKEAFIIAENTKKIKGIKE